MNFEQEKAAVLKITWTNDVDSFRRTVIPNSNFCWEVCREHFPKEHQPGIPSIVGTAITMPFRERTAFAPAVADVRYAFGPSLQPFGLYALGSSEKLFYGEFVMDFTYETVPGTRRIFDSPLVSRIRECRGDIRRMSINETVLHGRPLISCPAWDTYGSLQALSFDPAFKTMPLWFPGPFLTGPTEMSDVVKYYTGQRRALTEDSTVAVTFPFGPKDVFKQFVWLLPSQFTKLTVLVHTEDHANILGDCLEVISMSNNGIKELHIEYLSQIPWNLGVWPRRGTLERISFNGTSETPFVPLVSLWERNPNLHEVSIGATARLLFTYLHVLQEDPYITGATVKILDEDNPWLALTWLKEVTYDLQKIGLHFRRLPDWDDVFDIAKAHVRHLKDLTVVCQDSSRPHVCTSDCRDGNFLLRRMPNLERLEIRNLPCTSLAMFHVIRMQQPMHLVVSPSSGDRDFDARRFFLPSEMITPSVVTELTLENMTDLSTFAKDHAIWQNVRTLTINRLPLTSVPDALKLAIGVTTLKLQLLVDPMPIAEPKYALGDCRSGFADHLFVGTHDEDGDPDPQFGTLQQLQGLHALEITFVPLQQHLWPAPTLGNCFVRHGLQKLPGLLRFQANDVSGELYVYLADRNTGDFSSDTTRFRNVRTVVALH